MKPSSQLIFALRGSPTSWSWVHGTLWALFARSSRTSSYFAGGVTPLTSSSGGARSPQAYHRPLVPCGSRGEKRWQWPWGASCLRVTYDLQGFFFCSEKRVFSFRGWVSSQFSGSGTVFSGCLQPVSSPPRLHGRPYFFGLMVACMVQGAHHYSFRVVGLLLLFRSILSQLFNLARADRSGG